MPFQDARRGRLTSAIGFNPMRRGRHGRLELPFEPRWKRTGRTPKEQ